MFHILSKMSSFQLAVDSIHHSLSEICVADDHHYDWENPRRFSGYAWRLQAVINQVLRLYSPASVPASVQTSVKGIAGDLAKAVENLMVYEKKSKIFVLMNCQALCASLQESTLAIGGWLALLDLAVQDISDLHKKIAELSTDMKQAQFRVTENEERVHYTLAREGQGRQTSKVVQSAIVMDLARALGIGFNDHAELSKQVKLLKDDLADSCSLQEKQVLTSLETIVDNWSTEPDIFTHKQDLDFEDDAHISPFKNFLCPLTKEVMKDPVVLVSSQNYERTAINCWFERCLEDGREPTCPVTGEVLSSLELKSNIGLAGAIEEWVNRNIEICIRSAVQCLKEDPPSVEGVEHALDDIFKISEEHPSNRYRVRNAGTISLIVKVLRECSKSIRSRLRSKFFMALLSMAKDEESKNIMLEEGVTRLAIHGLIGSSEKEREYAVKLLLEFSSEEAYCVRIASEKGALVLLTSMADNLEHPALSKLAEEVLKLMERVEDNVQHLVVAGRFEPLLARLCEGSDDIKVQMSSMLGKMTLTNCSKEQIAHRCAKVLVDLLDKPEGISPSLQALNSLSSLDDNATILVDSGLLPALTNILFIKEDTSAESKELAASIIANIISSTGHWELASADGENHSLPSEFIISSLLGLLPKANPGCQVSILRTLHGILSSPQASESVTGHIKSADGLRRIVSFLDHPEIEHRIHAFRLTRLLSERLNEDLANELRSSSKLTLFKDKILNNQSTDGERSDAACILANLPLSETEVNNQLDPYFVKWTISALSDQRNSSNFRTARPTSVMTEGLVGLLLHIARSLDQQSLAIINENRLMSVFHDQLVFASNPKAKQLAALGLRHLSESGRTFGDGVESDPPPPNGFCGSLIFMCRKSSPSPFTCPIHNSPCKEDTQFCLLKRNCIKPLVDTFTYEDIGARIAAVEALSTLLDTSNSSKRAIDELERLGVVESAVELFVQARSGALQEKAIWMVGRFLREESLVQRHSLNQPLLRALVEAFKHGNSITKRHAQEALTNLKQISGVGGKTSSQHRARR